MFFVTPQKGSGVMSGVRDVFPIPKGHSTKVWSMTLYVKICSTGTFYPQPFVFFQRETVFFFKHRTPRERPRKPETEGTDKPLAQNSMT